jgi:acyl-coenzyme A synthetase/AMP-(fatty) acid ligase
MATLPDRVRITAERRGDAVAVVAGSTTLRYRSLHEAANRLANALRNRQVGPGDIVAIFLGRSVETVIAMIGIMRSGAAYTIVDADRNTQQPYKRLSESGAKLVLCADDTCASLSKRGLEAVSFASTQALQPNLPPIEIDSNQTAYVLFTSGSTGVPKGVAVTHDNIWHYTTGALERFAIETPHVDQPAATAMDVGLRRRCRAIWARPLQLAEIPRSVWTDTQLN